MIDDPAFAIKLRCDDVHALLCYSDSNDSIVFSSVSLLVTFSSLDEVVLILRDE